MKKTKNILIAGVGNILKGDDGLGPYTVEKLQKLNLPKNVELLDLGTLGLSILHYAEGYKKVIFIDAIKRGGKPGSIYKLKLKDKKSQNKIVNLESVTSMHEINLDRIIEIGNVIGKLKSTNIIIIGCEPEEANSLKIGLSERVEKALPKIIELVLEELKDISK